MGEKQKKVFDRRRSFPFYPGESVNSWLMRLSAVSAMNIAELNHMVKRPKTSWVDHDTTIAPYFLQRQAAQLGVPREVLYQGLIYHKIKFMYPSKLLPEPERLIWVIHSHRGASLGFQYCPLCLSEPQGSYLRLKWRWSFVTVCEQHLCYLQQNCQQCGTIFSPSTFTARPIFCCDNCGWSVKDAEIQEVPAFAALPIQSFLVNLMESEVQDPQLGAAFSVTGRQYMLFLRKLLRWFREAHSFYHQALAAATGVGFQEVPSFKRFESLRAGERFVLLSWAAHIICDWPSGAAALHRVAPAILWPLDDLERLMGVELSLAFNMDHVRRFASPFTLGVEQKQSVPSRLSKNNKANVKRHLSKQEQEKEELDEWKKYFT